MEDKEFFDRALQLQAPWFVRSVKLDLQEKKVELEIGVEKGWRWKDSEGRAAQVHGWEEREWRHLNTMQCETTIRARVPRLKYADGRVEEVAVPWAERSKKILSREGVSGSVKSVPVTLTVCCTPEPKRIFALFPREPTMAPSFLTPSSEPSAT